MYNPIASSSLLAALYYILSSRSTVFAQPPGVGNNTNSTLPLLVQNELDRCGLNVVDAHLHEAMWFDTAGPLLAEMTASGVAQGVIMAVYGPSNPFGTDPNEVIESFLSDSLFGLASLNTTGDWETAKTAELERLATFLEKPGFVGAKLAPPHTCLPLNSTVVDEILAVVNASSNPIIGIHSGTTPFCGPFGDAILGKRGCCEQEFVDPLVMEPWIAKYTGVTFVLMHSGQDFGFDPTIPFYNGTNVNHAIQLAKEYSNVYLEISANLARNETTLEYRNPLALENLVKIRNAGGLMNRVVYGSDANQFPGEMLPYLNSTIVSLIDAGYTEEERCQILIDNAQAAYALDDAPGEQPPPGGGPTVPPGGGPTVPPSPSPTMTTSSAMTKGGGLVVTVATGTVIGFALHW